MSAASTCGGRRAEAAAEEAARAWSAGAPMVIAAGGDGSIRAVVAGLLRAADVRSESPLLGLVPLGRGNDLVRGLGLPLDPRLALEALAAEDALRVAPLDVGRVWIDGRAGIFVNALGIGLDAEVAGRARSIPLGGLGAYLLALVRVLADGLRPWPAEVRIDGGPARRVAALLLTFGNGPSTGGGFRLVPRAVATDGVLDYCIGRKGPVLSILGLVPRILRGGHGGHRLVEMGRCADFEAIFSRPVAVHADGEVLASAAVHCRVGLQPAALRLACGGSILLAPGQRTRRKGS
ncbi:MAG: diacylglycerol kinase family protein [Acidobacteriota bacterium]|nr:diacylglycerol kinase family protein [Acidobacteriota bacterium]